MSWIEHPKPEAATSDYARETLTDSLRTNGGQMGMRAAFFTAPDGEYLARFVNSIHFGQTELGRPYKEMIATVVSNANGCQY